MKKAILKSTFAVVAVTASCLGAWKAYGAYGTADNSLLMQNIEALAGNADGEGGGTQLKAHRCYTAEAENGTNGFFGQHGESKTYLCLTQNFEFTEQAAKDKQTKCSKKGYRAFAGYGDDNKHWCVW